MRAHEPWELLKRRLRGVAVLLGGLGLLGVLSLFGASCLVTAVTRGDRLTRAKCGACHLRPQPGQVSRARLVKILEEHRKRFELAPEDRDAVLDHLAPSRTVSPSQSPSRPPP